MSSTNDAKNIPSSSYDYLYSSGFSAHAGASIHSTSEMLAKTKDLIQQKYINKGSALKAQKQKTLEGVGIYHFMDGEFEQQLSQIVNKVYNKTHTDGKLDIDSLNSYISQLKQKGEKLSSESSKFNNIMQLIKEIRDNPLYKEILSKQVVLFGADQYNNLENINNILLSIGIKPITIEKGTINLTYSNAYTLSQKLTSLYNEASAIQTEGGGQFFNKSIAKSSIEKDNKGAMTLSRVLSSYDGYLSEVQGFGYEFAIVQGFIESNLEGIEAINIGDIGTGKQASSNIKMTIGKLKSADGKNNKELLKKCALDLRSIADGICKGKGKTDVAIIFKTVIGQVYGLAEISIKSSRETYDPNSLVKNWKNSLISLGGFNATIESLINKTPGLKDIVGISPKVAFYNTWSNLTNDNKITINGQTVGPPDQHKGQALGADAQTNRWKTMCRIVGLLNISDALIGQIGVFGSSADYLIYDNYIFRTYDIIDKIYSSFVKFAGGSKWGDYNTIVSITVPKLDASLIRAHAIDSFQKPAKNTEEEKRWAAISRSNDVYGKSLGSLQAKLKINKLLASGLKSL